LTPDDIGSTVSLVVTATGKGGATSAPTPATPVVAAAPVPPAVPGSAVAQAGLAGAVSSPDGTATVTWQPGAVPIGSTVSVAAGLPTPRLVTALHVKRLADGSLLLATRVSLPSQAHLWIGIGGPTRQSLVLKPGAVPVRLHVSGRRLGRGALAHLRIAARDPWGRRATLVVSFRAP